MMLRLPTILLCLAAALCGSLSAHAQVMTSSGVFADKTGGRQDWNITGAHTLIWNGKPYVPVGGLFQAKSWAGNATEADFQSDVEALKLLKTHGVTDVYVQAAQGAGITSVRPEAIQRLVDYLDAEEFTYGFSLNDGPRDPLYAYLLRPGAFRQETNERSGQIAFPIKGLMSSLYFLVSSSGQEILDSGEASVSAEGARVMVRAYPDKSILYLLPQKAYFPQSGLGLPNLWDGFDAYRDTLIALFQKVRLGKGFRFFIDPLPANLTVDGEAERVIPTGAGFRTEWAEWLARRYKNIGNLELAWAIVDRDLRNFDEAAALLPFWGGGKGVPVLYDHATQKTRRVDAVRSLFWRNLSDFKTASVQGYMNDLALVLKKTAANVPVVYRSRGYSSLFARLPLGSGFDGIGIDAYGRGSELVTGSAGYVVAQAADAPRTLWLPVSATGDTLASKTAKGYASRVALYSDLDWLREIGARGFFVDGVRLTSPARANYDLSEMPEQLDWLSGYARSLVSPNGTATNDTLPPAIFYPRELASGSIRPLKGGGWMLPTDRNNVLFDFGSAGRAYALSEPSGKEVYYLFTPDGRERRVRIRIPKASRLPDAPRVAWSASANGEVKNNVLTLTIGAEPVRVENLASIPVPLDAFEIAASEATALIAVLRKRNDLNAGRFSEELGFMKKRYNEENPWLSFKEIQTVLTNLRSILRPYAWLEAEQDVTPRTGHSFDETALQLGASGGLVITVTNRPAGAPAAIANYTITAKEATTYDLWVAASPNAPLSFRLDGQPLLDQATLPQVVGAPYANGTLVWMRYGAATLPKGAHRLELRANGAATVDTLLFIKGEFVPDGPVPPPVKP